MERFLRAYRKVQMCIRDRHFPRTWRGVIRIFGRPWVRFPRRKAARWEAGLTTSVSYTHLESTSLTTSLLHNRTLVSGDSPLDRLRGTETGEAEFDALLAIQEVEGCYQALTRCV